MTKKEAEIFKQSFKKILDIATSKKVTDELTSKVLGMLYSFKDIPDNEILCSLIFSFMIIFSANAIKCNVDINPKDVSPNLIRSANGFIEMLTQLYGGPNFLGGAIVKEVNPNLQ